MKDNLSPEEKLLRLIKGHREEKVAKTNQPAMPVKKASKHFVFFNLKKYFSFFPMQRVVVAAFILAFIYFIISFVYPWIGLKKINLPRVNPNNARDIKIELKSEAKPYDFYLKAIENRQIFSSMASGGATKPESGINIDLTKDINLVGIIAGDNPQAVIEDKKTQKAYYVTKGQFIGDFQIEDIQEGKVIIIYQGQRFELYL